MFATHRVFDTPDTEGLVAWLLLDGNPASFYTRAIPDSNEYELFVEAKEGQKVAVCWTDQRQKKPASTYIMRLYLDGRE